MEGMLRRVFGGGEVMEMDGELAVVGEALDEISWDWLSDNFPALAEALQTAVMENGVTPERIRRFVMGKVQRYELALRCEQAARWLLGNGAGRN